MGFGLLFIGYFITFFMSYVFVPKIVGIVIMLFGLLKLSEYNLRFKRCVPITGFMGVLAFYMLAYAIFSKIGTDLSIFGEVALNTVSTCEEILNITFHVFLTSAIVGIAKETELPKISIAAVRDLSIGVMYEIMYLIMFIVKSFSPEAKALKYILYAVLIMKFAWIALNLVLIAGCYRQICPEGDEDMPVKESKIPIINKMEKVMRERDDNAFNAGKKFSEKRNNKKKNKKKK